MSAQTILYIILIILSIEFILDQVLEYLNLKSIRPEIPDELRSIYNEETYFKSLSYNKTKIKFSFYTSTFSFLLSFIVLSSGFLGVIDSVIRYYFHNEITQALGFFAIIYFGIDLISLPFQIYHTFVIEEKFGFNRTSGKTFILDKLKGYLIGIILGAIIVSILLILILIMGTDFWIYFWGVAAIFLIFINMFYTSVIIPLFNKLTPLPEGELKEAINDYSRKVNFPIDKILVIDGSKRSTKANAFFSGLGRKKKIVLYDTLIKNQTVQELVAVLAHEVGHFKKKHIYSGLVLSLLQIGFTLFILSFLIFNSEVSYALGGVKTSPHLNILAFGILYSPIAKVTGLFMNMLSRSNEFEADQYATETSDGASLQQALKKLSVDHLSNLLPNKYYVFFHYSHPPILKRLESIQNIEK